MDFYWILLAAGIALFVFACLLVFRGEGIGWLQHRQWIWVTFSVAALCFVMMKDADTLLGGVEGSGTQSYDASVFTGARLKFWDTSELRGAMGFWHCVPETYKETDCSEGSAAGLQRPPVKRFVYAHLALELGLTAALAVLLWCGLRAVGANAPFARFVGFAFFGFGTVATVYTGNFVLRNFDPEHAWPLWISQLLYLAKWIALTGAAIPLVIRAFQQGEGWSIQDAWSEIRHARHGDVEHPAIALAGLIVLVALFAGFVALPAGGPLDQIPDVLRYQVFRIGTGNWRLFLGAGGALVALSLAVLIAGYAATDMPAADSETAAAAEPDEAVIAAAELVPGVNLLTSFVGLLVLAVVLGFGVLALYVPGMWSREGPSIALLALPIVGLTLYVAAFLARLTGIGPIIGRPCADPPSRDSEQRVRWVSGIASFVLLAGGIGVVRGAFPPALLRVDGATLPWFPDRLWPDALSLGDAWRVGWWPDEVPWWAIAVAGGVTTIFAPIIFQFLVDRFEGVRLANSASLSLQVPVVLFVGLVVLLVGWLAHDPRFAHHLGATGVAAWCVAFFALLIGGVLWVSHRVPAWPTTGELGLGRRTPWIALLLVAYAVAAVLNTDADYYKARASSDLSTAEMMHTDLGAAYIKWRDVQLNADVRACGSASETVPMVLVAAPGGGIKAAYWTERALDELFGPTSSYDLKKVPGDQPGDEDPTCAQQRLFAISGVSGGSLGATTWITASAKGLSSETAMNGMADDEALSSAIAGLLLRDLPQPLTGVQRGWRDRAALLEDNWIGSASNVFGTVDDAVRWSEVGKGANWTPVLVLNGSSVNDGCRVLTSNTGMLPSAPPGADCYAVGPDGSSQAGPVSGALDPLEVCDEETSQRLNEMNVATAVLLSARFPVISPSGAISRCRPGRDPDRSTTYVVDGGYYENSGLLTLLQIWSAIEPLANASCEETDSTLKLCVEPWFLVLDSHYKSAATAAEPKRPNEIGLLQSTRGRVKDLISDRALEQNAVAISDTFNTITVLDRSDDPACGRLVHLGLAKRPAIAAPLGWVLSEVSRRNLTEELRSELKRENTPLADLRSRLRGEALEGRAGCKDP